MTEELGAQAAEGQIEVPDAGNSLTATTTGAEDGTVVAPPSPSLGDLHSIGGYRIDECLSALQKTIRRGLADDAVFWASELDLSGHGARVFNRLRIIASEDVGVADSNVAAQVRALYENWLEARNAKEPAAPDRLFLVHAVLILARAQKSRLVDHCLIVHYEGDRPHREVPDYVLDMHTRAGRQRGREVGHFFAEGILLENAADIEDPYLERALHWRAHPVRHQPAED